jgi:V8-like Glu-specific endopeptidase
MYRRVWDCCYRSVCSICFFTENGIKLTTLTGFRSENFIITDEYIFKVKNYYEVVFQFVERDGYSVSHAIKMSFNELNNRLNRIAEYENEGYALIQIDDLELSHVPSLLPEYSNDYQIGQSIAVLGFHGDQENMSLKTGIVSSFIKMDNGKEYIQFDAAIKQGNSGSPLINIETGKVIGVVGYRLSILTRSYEAFKNIIDENLRLLKKSEGKMNIMDIDPIQVLIANQNQLKQMSKEFYKTAMMSFGFAHEITSLKNYVNATEKAAAQSTTTKV